MLTLTQALALRGLTHRKAARGPYAKDILDGDRVVFTGTAHSTWQWLHATAVVECSCGASYDRESWAGLRLVGEVDRELLEPGKRAEQRNCRHCDSTMTFETFVSCAMCEAMERRDRELPQCPADCDCICHG
jgi:hypothetical protein